MRLDDSATFTATTTPHGWTVLGRIPALFVTPAPHATLPGAIWDINFGRYDYTTSGPTLSSTSPLTQPHFHRRTEWSTIRFV